MPVYVYKRDDDGTKFEVTQGIHDEPLDTVYDHTMDLWVKVNRVPQLSSISLRGRGFYRTGG